MGSRTPGGYWEKGSPYFARYDYISNFLSVSDWNAVFFRFARQESKVLAKGKTL